MYRGNIRIQVTNPVLGHRRASHHAHFLTRLLVAAVLAGLPGLASAAITWHPDLAAARAASAASGKPVFALFVATWDEDPIAEVFANAEVEAVLSACFEPVQVDVDARPDVVKKFAIDRIPSVAVLDGSGGAISRFDCPATPAEFVAAAARAAQVTASTATPRSDTEKASAAAAASFGGDFEASPPVDDTSVADKVRQLSNFAEGKALPLRDTSRFHAVAATAPAIPAQPSPATPPAAPTTKAPSVAPPAAPTAVASAAPTAGPVLARTPPAWPAERPSASAFTQRQPAAPAAAAAAATPTAIEPAPSTNPAPWLAAAPTTTGPTTTAPGVPPADTEPEASATASDDGTTAKAKPNAFMAAIQKPFDAVARWTAKPVVEPPPKMPPARPQLPSALAAVAAMVPQPTGAAPAAAADPGPMPLGLEGYCPVTIAERGAWVEGRAQWGVRHRGRTYLFAGPEQQQAFLTNPDQYAPALAGDDPVLAFESGRTEAGRRAYGVSYQSRMYLFTSPETKAAFSADPNRYTTRVQIAEGLAPSDAARRF